MPKGYSYNRMSAYLRRPSNPPCCKIPKGHKLCKHTAARLKFLVKGGYSPSYVAPKFNVSPSHASNIRHDRFWRDE